MGLESEMPKPGSTPAGGTIDQARLLSGRALAFEGVDEWKAALADYDRHGPATPAVIPESGHRANSLRGGPQREPAAHQSARLLCCLGSGAGNQAGSKAGQAPPCGQHASVHC